MTEENPQLRRLLDLFVYAPAGLVQSAAEEFEKLAEKGRHRVEGQIHTARLVGQFTVQTARTEAQKVFSSTMKRMANSGGGGRVSSREAPEPSSYESAVEDVRDPEPVHSDAVFIQPSPGPQGANGNEGREDLAIPGYDSLSASHVVQRLDGLSHSELEDVKSHELANRHRRTILHRLDQLLDGSTGDAY